MKRWLQILILRYQRQAIVDDLDHFSGVIAIGRQKIAKLEQENRWRVREAERLGRKIQALDRPQSLIVQSLRNRAA